MFKCGASETRKYEIENVNRTIWKIYFARFFSSKKKKEGLLKGMMGVLRCPGSLVGDELR